MTHRPECSLGARWRFLSGNAQGMAWMLLAAAFTVGMSAVIKHVVRDLPAPEVLFFRMALALLVLVPWFVRRGPRVVVTSRLRDHFVRGLAGVFSMACYVYALAGLALADFIALSFTRPLWMVLTSFFFLHEVVGLRRAGGIAAGFAGVLLIVRPQFDIQPAMILALLGGALSSVTLVQVKQLASTEPSARIVFYSSVFGALFSGIPAAFAWVTPTMPQLAWLTCSAVMAGIGQFCSAQAASAGDATVIAPMDFTQLPMAAVLGVLAFGEVPDLWVAIGTLIILAATLYIGRQGRPVSADRPPGRAQASLHADD
jgi:drug/metabolite transporter (DMT)-like permease